jgi:hypothetical protein
MSVSKKSFQQLENKSLCAVKEIAKIEKGRNKAVSMLSNELLIPVLANIVDMYLQDTSLEQDLASLLSDINRYIQSILVRRYQAKSTNIKSKATERLCDIKDLILELCQSNSMLTEEMLEKFEYVWFVYKRNRYEL